MRHYVVCSPWFKGWEVGALRDDPCQYHQSEEADAGQHYDFRFRIEAAHYLDVKEKECDVIDQMGEPRRPEAASPVVEVAEDKSTDGGCDHQESSFGNCLPSRRLTPNPVAERSYKMGEPEQECLQCVCFPNAKPPHELREHQPTEDGFLHERVYDLPEEVEQGEEKATHCPSLVIDSRKYKSRGFTRGA